MNIVLEKRKSLKKTQKQFSELTGLPVCSISKLENGGDFTSIEHGCRFCNAFPEEFEIRNMAVIKKGK